MSIRTAYLGQVDACKMTLAKWMLFISVFTFLAILLPYACHQFGLGGSIFLPMHFAVIFAALVIGLRGGIVVALISPTLSFAISGMPPLTSLLPMTIELVAYAVFINLFAKQLKLPVLAALLLAMLTGRVVVILVGVMMAGSFAGAVNFKHLFVASIPGILIQLAFIPPLAAKVSTFVKGK